jgi:hypothetical protein
MGRAKRNPSTCARDDGFRFALPILRETRFRNLATRSPEACFDFTPSKSEGAGKTGCTLHPRSRVRFALRKCTRAYRSSGGIRPSLRNGFTAYFVLSPVNGCFATVAPKKLASRELDASTAASEPHDFAVRVMPASSVMASASTASHRAFVTIASRPSCRVGRAHG